MTADTLSPSLKNWAESGRGGLDLGVWGVISMKFWIQVRGVGVVEIQVTCSIS